MKRIVIDVKRDDGSEPTADDLEFAAYALQCDLAGGLAHGEGERAVVAGVARYGFTWYWAITDAPEPSLHEQIEAERDPS